MHLKLRLLSTPGGRRRKQALKEEAQAVKQGAYPERRPE